jgi:hypothetical protein
MYHRRYHNLDGRKGAVMNKGDIIQRYKKHNPNSADFYVVLGECKKRGVDRTIILGFYKDGTATTLYRIWNKDLYEFYRVVGHTDFVFDINRQIELMTVDKKDNK